MSTLSRRYWRALTGGSPADDESPPERGREGYGLWQRYWSALLGIRLPPKHDTVPESRPAPQVRPSVRGRPIRLPRFDLVTTWQASTAVIEPEAVQWTVDGRQFTIRDAGPGEIELLIRQDGPASPDHVVPVLVTTRSSSHLYFMVLIPEESGGSVGVLRLAVNEHWVDVSIEQELPVSTLDGTRRAIRDQIADSVAASPDPAMPAWAAIAASRPEGDPLSQVIRDAAG